MNRPCPKCAPPPRNVSLSSLPGPSSRTPSCPLGTKGLTAGTAAPLPPSAQAARAALTVKYLRCHPCPTKASSLCPRPLSSPQDAPGQRALANLGSRQTRRSFVCPCIPTASQRWSQHPSRAQPGPSPTQRTGRGCAEAGVHGHAARM